MKRLTTLAPSSMNEELGNEMNEVMGKAMYVLEDSRKRFPGVELLLVIIRDKENSKSVISAFPKNVFLDKEIHNFEGLPADDPAVTQMREPAGDAAVWMLTFAGKNWYSGRARFPSAGQGVVVGAGMTNEAMPDRELLTMSLSVWNAKHRGESASLAMAIVKGETPLPPLFGVGFCEAWADQGYPRLVTQHKFAAALMCTKVSADDVSDVHIPWTAFQVAVPNGLLVRDDTHEEYSRIVVLVDKGEAKMALYTQQGRASWILASMPAASLLAADGEVSNEELMDEGTSRISFLARRLVAGLLLTLDHSAHFKDHADRGPARHEGREDPDHRVFMCGRAISVDCRPSIKAYLRPGAKSTPAAVQVLVRGHYKRQVIGVDRSGRKVIWVEPYWRGPEDAPILTRPYRVGATN